MTVRNDASYIRYTKIERQIVKLIILYSMTVLLEEGSREMTAYGMHIVHPSFLEFPRFGFSVLRSSFLLSFLTSHFSIQPRLNIFISISRLRIVDDLPSQTYHYNYESQNY
jgi:hypothetical protein